MSLLIPLREGRSLTFSRTPSVMAILNVTPDSFSDGGRLESSEAAVEGGLRFAQEGASIVDVGGESTRPRGRTYGAGASEVPVEEELRRVIPVIAGLRAASPHLPISVDTRRAEVAEAAIAQGADVVNVVTGLACESRLLAVVAAAGAALVLNHCRGTPATTFEISRFAAVVEEVAADLAVALEFAEAAGVAREKILLDPGFGFGKTADENFALLSALDRIAPAGIALVAGASRKAFLTHGKETSQHLPPRERLPESLAAVAVAWQSAGTRPLLLRVHDVAETTRFLSVLERSGRFGTCAEEVR